MSLANILFTVIIYPLIQILEFIFVFFQKVFKETGLSILGISVAISLLTLPLYSVAEQWQKIERSVQDKMRPGINKIKSIFKGDEQYMILTTFYRQNHYHPIYALRSTFGLLIQIPFFIAAYSFLSGLEAMKGASFFFVPDMGAPDGALSLGDFRLNLLPILMTLVNIGSAALYTRGFSAKEKIQLYLMALIFLVFLYNAPSGLVIYWTMNNIFSLLKNLYASLKTRYKILIPAVIISLVCLFTVYYILFVHNGSAEQRRLIALLSVLLSILPWLIIFIRRSNFKIYFRETGNIVLFCLSLFVLWTLIGLYIPSSLIVSSPDEFSFIDNYENPTFFLTNTALQAFGFFLFWPLALYLLFSQKTKTAFTLFFFVLCGGALCNVFIFPGNYGLISATLQFSGEVNHSGKEVLLNLCLLVIFAVIFFLLFIKFKLSNILIPITAICSITLFVLSFINTINIQRAFLALESFHKDTKQELTETKSLFTLSNKGKNTVIIMLDRASSSFFPYILEEDPSLYEKYAGFVYYPNTVSFNGYTNIGAPPVFGGYEYTPEAINKRKSDTLVKKHNEALLLLPTIFSAAGFLTTVTDPPYPNYSTRDDFSIYNHLPNTHVAMTDSVYTKIWIKENNFPLPSASKILKRDILWYSLFRSIPPLFRWTVYQRGDWCSSIPGQKITGLLNGYSVIDYLPRLTNITDDNINTALIMVNNSTHEGAFLEAPDYKPSLNIVSYGTSPFSKETEYHINIAAFKRLADWFTFLQENSVYDNTRIILVSDHGSQISYVTKAPEEMPANFDNLHPILFFKDFYSRGTLAIDDTFMSNADVPFLALRGQIDKPLNPFTGNEITVEPKKNPLYIAVSGSVHRSNTNTTGFALDPAKDFYVHTNIFDPKNWERAVKQ